MSTSFSVWMKAQGIYAALMLPTLIFPPMFIMSEFYAWLWGTPALLFFHFLLVLLKKKGWFHLPFLIGITFLITLLCTYAAAWHFVSFEKNPWEEFLDMILFPAAGWGAGVLAVAFSRNSLEKYILNKEDEELLYLEAEIQSKET